MAVIHFKDAAFYALAEREREARGYKSVAQTVKKLSEERLVELRTGSLYPVMEERKDVGQKVGGEREASQAAPVGG